MAYTLSDFPLSTEEARIDVNLPVGTHVLELVVEDSAGLRSLPDTVIITVEPAEVPSASITAIEPLSALKGTTFDLTIRGTGLAQASSVVFYTELVITPTRPTLPTGPILTRPSLPDLPILPPRPVKVPDSSIKARITDRGADGITVKVTIDSSSTTGTRTLGVVTPQGTVPSGTLTFTVRALPTITIPTVTRPTVTIPTVTRPTLTLPTVTVPTLTVPTVTRPTATIPTVTRPTATIPTVTRPTMTVPTLTRPVIFDTAPTLASVRGVGAATETKLKAAGINSVRDLAMASPDKVAEVLGYQDTARAKAMIDEAARLIG